MDGIDKKQCGHLWLRSWDELLSWKEGSHPKGFESSLQVWNVHSEKAGMEKEVKREMHCRKDHFEFMQVKKGKCWVWNSQNHFEMDCPEHNKGKDRV